MSWFLWIIIGLIAGWIAEKVTQSRHGILTNLVVGLVGALIGGWIMSLLGFSYDTTRFWPSLIVAAGGAIVLLLVLHFIFRRRSSPAA